MVKSLSTWIILLTSCIVYALMLFVSSSHFNENIAFLDQVSKVLFGDFIAMFLAIFISIFWYADYKNGYIKNTWNIIGNKLNYIFSKMICIFIFLIIEYCLLLLTSFVFNLFYLHNDKLGNWTPFIKCLFCQLMLNSSFGSIIVLINCIVKNHAIAIASCIAYVTIAPITVYSTINLIISKAIDNEDFSVGDYLPYGNLYKIVPDSSLSDYSKAYAISFIFLIISIISTFMLIRKREIK